MDPVEINAGTWYLRPLSSTADEDDAASRPRTGGVRIDDRPAVLASFLDPEIRRWRRRPPPELAEADAYIRQRAHEWARDERFTWAVCEPTTGEMHGEIELAAVDLRVGTAEAACWALPQARNCGMTTTALSAVLRFAFGGLGLKRVSYSWAEGNTPSARVAFKCGFRPEGRRRSAWLVDGERVDVYVASRSATE